MAHPAMSDIHEEAKRFHTMLGTIQFAWFREVNLEYVETCERCFGDFS